MTSLRTFRVAMVVASPFPANHGTPGSIREMIAAVAARGHEIHVVAYKSEHRVESDGLKLHAISAPGMGKEVVVGPTWKKPFLDSLMFFKLCWVVWREGIDVIHAHNYEGALIGFLAKIFTRRPLIYNAVNTMADELPSYGVIRPHFLARWLARQLDHWVPRMADRTIAISEELGRFLREQGVEPSSIDVIPLGIEAERFSGADPEPIRREHRLRGGPVVLYTGVLAPLQRIDYLLEAMHEVVRARPDAELLIAVNCPRAHEIEELRHMLDRVGLGAHSRIAPIESFDEIPAFLAAADVTVVPRPNCPGFPVKLLNYMAASKPIVVFEGSAKGLVHMHSAILAKDHDWRGLAQGILAILEDPALGERLGRNAHQLALEQFNWPMLAQKTVGVYWAVLPADKTRT